MCCCTIIQLIIGIHKVKKYSPRLFPVYSRKKFPSDRVDCVDTGQGTETVPRVGSGGLSGQVSRREGRAGGFWHQHSQASGGAAGWQRVGLTQSQLQWGGKGMNNTANVCAAYLLSLWRLGEWRQCWTLSVTVRQPRVSHSVPTAMLMLLHHDCDGCIPLEIMMALSKGRGCNTAKEKTDWSVSM